MSHVTASKCIITDLAILKKVIKTMFPELVWNENKKTYAWYGSFRDDWGKQNEQLTARARGVDPSQYGKCEHSISLPGCRYEIGVTRRKDGEGYSLVWDVYNEGAKISNYIGKDAEKLMAEYSKEYIREFAERNGFIMEETTDHEGNLVLAMTAP